MEKIRIKTAASFQLNAWKNDKIQFIVLEDLLKAMQVEYVEDVIEFIKKDMHWFTSIKQLDIPEVGTRDAIQITHALGLIYWLPTSVVEFIPKHEVYNALAVHLELFLEFFQFKLAEFGRLHDKIVGAYAEMEKANQYIISQQTELIDKIKSDFNLL